MRDRQKKIIEEQQQTVLVVDGAQWRKYLSSEEIFALIKNNLRKRRLRSGEMPSRVFNDVEAFPDFLVEDLKTYFYEAVLNHKPFAWANKFFSLFVELLQEAEMKNIIDIFEQANKEGIFDQISDIIATVEDSDFIENITEILICLEQLGVSKEIHFIFSSPEINQILYTVLNLKFDDFEKELNNLEFNSDIAYKIKKELIQFIKESIQKKQSLAEIECGITLFFSESNLGYFFDLSKKLEEEEKGIKINLTDQDKINENIEDMNHLKNLSYLFLDPISSLAVCLENTNKKNRLKNLSDFFRDAHCLNILDEIVIFSKEVDLIKNKQEILSYLEQIEESKKIRSKFHKFKKDINALKLNYDMTRTIRGEILQLMNDYMQGNKSLVEIKQGISQCYSEKLSKLFLFLERKKHAQKKSMQIDEFFNRMSDKIEKKINSMQQLSNSFFDSIDSLKDGLDHTNQKNLLTGLLSRTFQDETVIDSLNSVLMLSQLTENEDNINASLDVLYDVAYQKNRYKWEVIRKKPKEFFKMFINSIMVEFFGLILNSKRTVEEEKILENYIKQNGSIKKDAMDSDVLSEGLNPDQGAQEKYDDIIFACVKNMEKLIKALIEDVCERVLEHKNVFSKETLSIYESSKILDLEPSVVSCTQGEEKELNQPSLSHSQKSRSFTFKGIFSSKKFSSQNSQENENRSNFELTSTAAKL